MSLIKKHFNTGKYKGSSYLDVWTKDKNYLYWMAGQFPGYWENIVRVLEERDKQINQSKPKPKVQFPSVDKVKEIFTQNPILGFDMSDYICELYQLVPDGLKYEYYQSLLIRNNIK